MDKIRLPRKLRNDLRRLYTRSAKAQASLGKRDGTISGSRANFIWVTDSNGDEVEVFNDVIPANKWGHGLPLWLTRVENSPLWQVAGIRQTYPNSPVSKGVLEHNPSHTAYGNDPVWVWSDQFMPWLFMPINLTLKIYRAGYWSGSSWIDAYNEILDLSSYVPSSGAKYVLVEVNLNGTLVVTAGSTVASRELLSISAVPAPTAGRLALCGVRLYAGQTVIVKNGVDKDIYDFRFSRVFGGGSGGALPGGLDGYVQFNKAGVLAGDSKFVFDYLIWQLTVNGNVISANGMQNNSLAGFPRVGIEGNSAGFAITSFVPGYPVVHSLGLIPGAVRLQTTGISPYKYAYLRTTNLTADRYFEFPDNGNELVVQSTDHLDFDTTPTGVSAVGRLVWNADEETLDLGMPNSITQQIGHELFFSVKNSTGDTITDGTPVMFAGTTGNSGHVLIQKAIADGTLQDEITIGLMTHEIANGSFGKATWFGKVRGIDTTGSPYGQTWADGDLLWISQTTAGYLTNVEPATGQKILIAAVVHAHSKGTLLIRPSWGNYVPRSQQQDTKDPTGWVDNTDIAVSYDVSTRKITLTGTLDYYWQGVKKSLSSPWVSDAHSSDDGRYFLYTEDGVTFSWSTTPWDFYDLMVAIARKYSTSPAYQFGLLEVHGLMPWQTHRELHETISAYRVSGGGLTAGTYTVNTASDAATTPGFDSMVMADEDIEVTIAAWTQGTYTTLRIGASNYPSFDVAASFPFRSSGSYILVNNPATGAETAAGNNQYVNVYIVRMPATSDADSQKYRLVCLQPQRTFTSLAAAQAEDTRSLSLGDLVPSVPEIVFYERITYVLASGDSNTGKCRIATGGISYIYGSRMSQISAPGYANPTAENVIFTPAGSIAAVNVQAAIEELDTEKAPLASPALTGDPTAPTPSAGDNGTSIATTAFVTGAIRKKLTANTTYYVATTGNDTTGDGTSGNPWATIQKAYDYIVANLDVAGYTVTIQVADGTYTAGLVAASSWSGGGSVVIQGNTGNKNSVYVSVTSKHCFRVSVGVVLSGALTLKYLKLATTTFGSGIYHSGIGIINFDNINFAACAQYHVICDNAGGVVYVNGAYEISGNAAAHWIAGGGGVIWGYSQTATISANLAFSLGFTYVSVLGIVKSTMTWSLGAYAVTGTRYHTYSNAAIYVASTGANHFPGNSAGVTDGYGYYG